MRFKLDGLEKRKGLGTTDTKEAEKRAQHIWDILHEKVKPDIASAQEWLKRVLDLKSEREKRNAPIVAKVMKHLGTIGETEEGYAAVRDLLKDETKIKELKIEIEKLTSDNVELRRQVEEAIAKVALYDKRLLIIMGRSRSTIFTQT